jgi:hypothetical protein
VLTRSRPQTALQALLHRNGADGILARASHNSGSPPWGDSPNGLSGRTLASKEKAPPLLVESFQCQRAFACNACETTVALNGPAWDAHEE